MLGTAKLERWNLPCPQPCESKESASLLMAIFCLILWSFSPSLRERRSFTPGGGETLRLLDGQESKKCSKFEHNSILFVYWVIDKLDKCLGFFLTRWEQKLIILCWQFCIDSTSLAGSGCLYHQVLEDVTHTCSHTHTRTTQSGQAVYIQDQGTWSRFLRVAPNPIFI